MSTSPTGTPPELGGHARVLGGTRGGRSRLLDTPTTASNSGSSSTQSGLTAASSGPTTAPSVPPSVSATTISQKRGRDDSEPTENQSNMIRDCIEILSDTDVEIDEEVKDPKKKTGSNSGINSASVPAVDPSRGGEEGNEEAALGKGSTHGTNGDDHTKQQTPQHSQQQRKSSHISPSSGASTSTSASAPRNTNTHRNNNKSPVSLTEFFGVKKKASSALTPAEKARDSVVLALRALTTVSSSSSSLPPPPVISRATEVIRDRGSIFIAHRVTGIRSVDDVHHVCNYLRHVRMAEEARMLYSSSADNSSNSRFPAPAHAAIYGYVLFRGNNGDGGGGVGSGSGITTATQHLMQNQRSPPQSNQSNGNTFFRRTEYGYTEQGYDDDGEEYGGKKILSVLQDYYQEIHAMWEKRVQSSGGSGSSSRSSTSGAMDGRSGGGGGRCNFGVCVVVSRWFGGVLLGPARFTQIARITHAALRDAVPIDL